MRIIYNAKRNPQSDNTEDHIRYALESLGHEVARDGGGDIYLYHKSYDPPKNFRGKSVMWFFDKVEFGSREAEFLELASHAAQVFMTDGSYAPKIGATVLRQGIGDELDPKPVRFEMEQEIGFVGSIYGQRMATLGPVAQKYGERFGIFEGYHGKDLYDLYFSLKILIAPLYPSEDHYWSNRVYLTTGAGGFLLHPDIKGIREEFSENELVLYTSTDDLLEKIDYYLTHNKEREAIRKAGQNKTRSEYTFKKRCEKLLEHLNTGTSA